VVPDALDEFGFHMFDVTGLSEDQYALEGLYVHASVFRDAKNKVLSPFASAIPDQPYFTVQDARSFEEKVRERSYCGARARSPKYHLLKCIEYLNQKMCWHTHGLDWLLYNFHWSIIYSFARSDQQSISQSIDQPFTQSKKASDTHSFNHNFYCVNVLFVTTPVT
jgi:hypothetical protein